MKYVLYIYLIFIALMSITDFILYGIDKSKAKKGQWRIKEATLLLTGFFGGAVGALLGMKIFHHKTKHWYFLVVNIAGLIAQTALLIFLIVKCK